MLISFMKISNLTNVHSVTKLLEVKDRNGKGRLDFGDFSKWFGSAIHKSEGFYFRHDTKKVNPEFDYNK